MAELEISVFRRTAKRALKEVLSPAGFERVGKLYVRHIGDQFHAMDVQTHGLDFCINLCFHYDFLPSLATRTPEFRKGKDQWREFGVPDYLMKTRLGWFESEVWRDKWWSFGEDADRTAALIRQKARAVLEAFDDVQRRWADPKIFLKILPPDYLLKEVIVPEEPQPKPGILSSYILCPWEGYHTLALSEFCAIVAAREGRSELAGEYRRGMETLIQRYKKRDWL
jgi:hypothetical protein